MHAVQPPRRVDREGRIDEEVNQTGPTVPFNSDDIPFMSISKNRLDRNKDDFAPSIKDGRKQINRRNGDAFNTNEIEDDIISNSKVVDLDEKDAKENPLVFPLLFPEK